MLNNLSIRIRNISSRARISYQQPLIVHVADLASKLPFFTLLASKTPAQEKPLKSKRKNGMLRIKTGFSNKRRTLRNRERSIVSIFLLTRAHSLSLLRMVQL